MRLSHNPGMRVLFVSDVYFPRVNGVSTSIRTFRGDLAEAGVQTLLQGAQRRASSENELLLETEKTFDLLYEAYG